MGLFRISLYGLALLALLARGAALAEDENPTTPGAIPNPGSYQGSMALQQQEQQQYQQQEQQNQQMQQRLNQNYQQYAPRPGGGGGQGGAPQINWWTKPALPAARNPLLGRWRQIASRAPQNSLAGLLGGMLSGGCQSMFGKGVVAFEPDSLQWVAPDGHEEILNHVAYRANGADVVMISHDPGAIPALFFGFPNHDRAVVALFNCNMERVGAKPALAPPSSAGAPQAGTQARSAAPPANAVLHLRIGKAAPGSFVPLAGVQVWVTREDPELGLKRASLLPGGGPLGQRLADDCHNAANCVRDWRAMEATALGAIRSDAAGLAATPTIPAGHYFLVGFTPTGQTGLFWSLPVDLKPGSNSITLDQTNGTVLR